MFLLPLFAIIADEQKRSLIAVLIQQEFLKNLLLYKLLVLPIGIPFVFIVFQLFVCEFVAASRSSVEICFWVQFFSLFIEAFVLPINVDIRSCKSFAQS